MTRRFWVLIHRYAGLYMAFFLLVAGLTGSILAFDGEIRDWLNPPSRVAVRPQPMLDPVALRERALALAPQGQITWVSFHCEPGEAHTVSFEPRTDPATGKPYALPFNTLTLDPYTGDEIGRSQWPEGLWPITRQNFIAVIIALHYRLAVAGQHRHLAVRHRRADLDARLLRRLLPDLADAAAARCKPAPSCRHGLPASRTQGRDAALTIPGAGFRTIPVRNDGST